jgi:hypothetical protein
MDYRLRNMEQKMLINYLNLLAMMKMMMLMIQVKVFFVLEEDVVEIVAVVVE